MAVCYRGDYGIGWHWIPLDGMGGWYGIPWQSPDPYPPLPGVHPIIPPYVTALTYTYNMPSLIPTYLSLSYPILSYPILYTIPLCYTPNFP